MDLLNNYKINNQGSEIANNFKKFGLYDSENRVIVYLEEFNEEKIKEFKENVCDSDAIVFAQGFGAIETQSSWSPGQPARNASDQGALTLGYRAKFGSTIGIVTAAHAVKMGEELIWNGDRFAKATIRNLGGSCDAVFCKMINSHDATNTLYGTGNTLSTTISEPGVGTTINKIGFTSGHTSGRVVATDVSADTDTGVFLTIMIGFILLISDAPFLEAGIGNYLIRSKRSRWFLGQIAYILFLSVIYNIFLLLITTLPFIPYLRLSTNWSPLIQNYFSLQVDTNYSLAFADTSIADTFLLFLKDISPL